MVYLFSLIIDDLEDYEEIFNIKNLNKNDRKSILDYYYVKNDKTAINILKNANMITTYKSCKTGEETKYYIWNELKKDLSILDIMVG
jgi:hypothetical protein